MKKNIKFKIIKLLTFLSLLLIFNCNNVYANVICNDGWMDSSCIVSSNGCCSHHGGVKDSSYSGSNYYVDDRSEFIQNLENGDYAGIITILIFCIPILFLFIPDNDDKK